MRAVRRMAYLSIATSLVTIVLKFGAYLLTGSVSLWSDALESLVNLAAGLVALGALTLEYSLNNASTFNSSLAPFGAGQCIRSVGAPGSAPGGLNSFAAIGDWGLLSESNGPAISTETTRFVSGYSFGFNPSPWP